MTENTTTVRLAPAQRKALIIMAAVKVSNENGLFSWNFKDVASACGVYTAPETIKNYFRKFDDLRAAVARHPDANDDVKSTAKNLGIVTA